MLEYIDKQKELNALCKKLQGAEILSVDTEFIGERTYYPQLALIQIGFKDVAYIVDPVAIKDLSPLKSVLSNNDTVVLMHDGDIDSSILLRACGATVPNLFDTQVAASFSGMPEQIGLVSLVRKVKGKKLSKGQQVTNWLKRPLSKKQLIYAADDVLYLEDIYHYLMRSLKRKKRFKIYQEEMALKREKWASPVDIFARFKKMLNSSRLTVRKREALFRLLTWREETAQTQDKPRRHILSDEAIAALADQLPQKASDLKNLRLVSDKAAKKYEQDIIEICDAVRNMSDERLPARKQTHSNGKRTKSKIPAVKMAMEVLADQAGIAPGLIARSAEIEELCKLAGQSDKMPDLPCFKGWRGRLVGEKLWKFAKGEVVLRIGNNQKSPAVILEDLKK